MSNNKPRANNFKRMITTALAKPSFFIICVIILCLLPDKAFAAASTFALSGDATGSYSELSDAIVAANEAPGQYVVTISGDDCDLVSTPVIAAGVDIILQTDNASSAISVTKASGRHFAVNGALTLKNIVLNGAATGGGVTVANGARLIMDRDSVIQKCLASRGGGVYVYAGGELDMRENSSIDACQSTYKSTGGSGGGVYLEGKFTMNDNTAVTNCIANGGKGGGVAVCLDNALFTLNGGRISGNKVLSASSDFMGGGVLVYDYDSSGGGSMFIMNDGEISNNEAAVGGGVSIARGTGQFIMNGGKISGNKAVLSTGVSGFGGGIYVMAWGENPNFKMNGGEISGNDANYGGGLFTVDMPKTEVGGVIKNNTAVYGGGVFNQGELILFGDSAITDNTATSCGGLYLHIGAVNMKDNSVISGNRATWAGGVYVRYVASMTMSGNAAITNNTADDNAGGVWIRETATFIMNGGTISDNRALKTNANSDAYGGGVMLAYPGRSTDPTFIMNSGAVSNNYAESYGGGIAAFNGTVTIDGGAVSQNISDSDGGGIYIAETAKTTIANASLTGNTAAGSGGAIFTESYEYADPLTYPTKYQNISTTNETAFSDNTADTLYHPPGNPDFLPNIDAYSVSAGTLVDHPLNNYDINYKSTQVTGLYNVIYNANGGVGAEYPVAVSVGTAHTILSADDVGFSRGGYTFLGWSTGSTALTPQHTAGSSIGDTATAGEITTLYAVWRADTTTPPPTEPPARSSVPPPSSVSGSDIDSGEGGILFGEGYDDEDTGEWIPEEILPLGEVPKTGDSGGVVAIAFMLAGTALIILITLPRKRKS